MDFKPERAQGQEWTLAEANLVLVERDLQQVNSFIEQLLNSHASKKPPYKLTELTESRTKLLEERKKIIEKLGIKND